MANGAAQPEHVYGDVSSAALPSGFRLFITLPDFLMITDWVFGGLVWILVASTRIWPMELLQGWVMYVSVFCFVITTILMFLYLVGAHGGKSSWTALDATYHSIAALFYLSAAVLQAYVTVLYGYQSPRIYKRYGENVSAVVFAYLATLSYVIHALFSLIRWKRAG
ncbi:myelin and lymphocyte protein [Ambystoma mexicanum]|uniref:myelin and lymphocyte protein n=1 Tax=Ambystoma mexicanum TaxID=8296 RepID=UPI0037E71343